MTSSRLVASGKCAAPQGAETVFGLEEHRLVRLSGEGGFANAGHAVDQDAGRLRAWPRG